MEKKSTYLGELSMMIQTNGAAFKRFPVDN